MSNYQLSKSANYYSRVAGYAGRVTHRTPRLTPLIYYSLPFAFLLLFYFYPLISILSLSFAPEGRLDLTALARLIETTYYAKTLWFTLWQAALSTLLTLLLALPAAYVFARYRFRGKGLLRSLTTIPFVLPTIVVANAFGALLGPRGTVNTGLMSLFQLDEAPLRLQHTVIMILLAHMFYNYTIVLRLVGGFWSNLNPQLVEAGQMLGASPWRAFRQITLPLLTPAIAAAGLLIFIFSFTSFGVILILGGPRYATLEVEIYRQAVNLFNLPLAAALALIQIMILFGAMLIYTRLQARTSRPLSLQSRQAVQRVPRSWPERLVVWGNVGVMLILLGAPLAALALRSLIVTDQFSGAYYQALFAETHRTQSIFFVPPSEGITNSIIFALSTVALATLLGLLVTIAMTTRGARVMPSAIGPWRQVKVSAGRSDGRSRPAGLGLRDRLQGLVDSLFMLPLATSAVTLGFGYIITLNTPPLNLRTSPILIVIAHTLVALPFVIRSVLPAVRTIQPVLREAAASLGASPVRVWREVDLPIASRALLVGAVFAFTISMGEFGATLFIARPDTPTMPIAIYRFLDQPGSLNYGQALAMSTLLMLVCGLGFVMIERFRVGNGEF
jgi:thiamine transport system permease protein